LVEAFILVRVRPASLDEASNVMKNVKEAIAKIRGVKEIKGVFGRYARANCYSKIVTKAWALTLILL
jgi:hypothetical protein